MTSCILFDLDGTLLNTNDLVLNSLQFTIRKHLQKEIDPCELYKYFGQPLVKIMEELSPAHAEQMVITYREHNAENHDIMTRVFPKVQETLQELKKEGVRSAIVTSKLKSIAIRGLQLFNLEDYFDVCIAYEDTSKHKPEPDPIIRALNTLGIEPEPKKVIMVGDSPYDIMCAKNAGVTSAFVSWSLHPREVIEEFKPDIWLNELPMLLDYIRS